LDGSARPRPLASRLQSGQRKMTGAADWLPEIVENNVANLVARSAHRVDRLKASLAEQLQDNPRLLESLPAIAALVTAAAPWADDDALDLASRMDLWVFMIDDRFDTSGCPGEDLAALAAGCGAVAEARTAEARTRTMSRDPILIELAKLRRELFGHPMFEIFGRRWANSVSRMADAMLREWRWAKDFQAAGCAALPPLDEYLEIGQDSVGVMPHIWLTCITSGDVSCVHHLPYLDRMAKIASRSVRLANDLRSAAREASEGGINALVVLTRAQSPEGATQCDATSRIEARIARDLARLETLRSHSVTDTGRAESSIAAVARYLCRFYGRRDFFK
jgi:Terpene synthase family 2, C-terminal metal binding